MHDLKRFDEALACYDQLLPLRPNDGNTFNNRGKILKELNRYDEAFACSARALALLPENIVAHCNESLMRLLTGDFARGFLEYEWRWKKADMAPAQRNFPQPLWLGEATSPARPSCCTASRASATRIQFCRYAPLVAARGARVILEVQPPLARLMGSLAGRRRRSLRAASALPAFDLHCPLLSLPLAFGTRLATIPRRCLTCARPRRSARLARAARRHAAAHRPRLVGQSRHMTRPQRSIALARLCAAAAMPTRSFVSLQKEVGAGDAGVLAAHPRHSPISAMRSADFADTAALIAQLDLVISVDTASRIWPARWRKPVWILLPSVPDWRWMLERDDSPWYPTARLFRQPRRATGTACSPACTRRCGICCTRRVVRIKDARSCASKR